MSSHKQRKKESEWNCCHLPRLFICAHFDVEACQDHFFLRSRERPMWMCWKIAYYFSACRECLKARLKMTTCQFWEGFPNSYFIKKNSHKTFCDLFLITIKTIKEVNQSKMAVFYSCCNHCTLNPGMKSFTESLFITIGWHHNDFVHFIYTE